MEFCNIRHTALRDPMIPIHYPWLPMDERKRAGGTGDAWKMSDGGAQAQEFRKIVGMPKRGDGFDWEICNRSVLLSIATHSHSEAWNGCLKVTGQWLISKELTPVCNVTWLRLKFISISLSHTLCMLIKWYKP